MGAKSKEQKEQKSWPKPQKKNVTYTIEKNAFKAPALQDSSMPEINEQKEAKPQLPILEIIEDSFRKDKKQHEKAKKLRKQTNLPHEDPGHIITE